MDDLRFTKIRYDRKNVVLDYEFTAKGGVRETRHRDDPHQPLDDFTAALRAFRDPLGKVFGFPAQYAHDIEIFQLTASYKGDRMGIVISGSKPIPGANAPGIFHTPYLPEPADESNGEGTMTTAMIQAWEALEAAAKLYLEGKHAQLSFDLEEPQPKPKRRMQQAEIEQEIEDEKREAARRTIMRESEAVLRWLLPATWEGNPQPSDNEIATVLLDVFDDVEFTDEHADLRRDRKWPGLILHVPETPLEGGSLAVWCQVSGEKGVPVFWYDIDPENYSATIPTLRGEPLFAAVRRIYGMAAPEAPLADVPEHEPASSSEETPEEWFRRVRPRPADKSERTSILMQAVHTVIAESDTAEAWRDIVREGASDDEITSMLETLLIMRGNSQVRFGWSEPIGMNTDKAVEFVEIEVSISPLWMAVGKGRQRQKVEAAQLVPAIRAWLDIPQPAPAPATTDPQAEETTETAEQQEPAEAGAAV